MRTITIGLLAFATLAGAAGQAGAQINGRSNGAAGPGTCGQYAYWHAGKCIDARTMAPAKPWSDDMLAKKWAG